MVSTSPRPSTWAACGAASGASSSTAEAIVPVNPNEFTSARRTSARHGRDRSGTRTGQVSQAMRLDGLSIRCGNTVPRRSCSTVLMTPPMPAAASMCPIPVLSEPTRIGFARLCDCPNTSAMEAISIGSPSGVPVP